MKKRIPAQSIWEENERARRKNELEDKKRIGKFVRSQTDDFLCWKVINPLRRFLSDMAEFPMTADQHNQRKKLYDTVENLHYGREDKNA